MTQKSHEEYAVYFCHANEDRDWVLDNLVSRLESKQHGLRCAQYDRDFPRIGAYITDLWREFFEKSKFIVVVLSPDFRKSTEAMFQLHLAVHYCYTTDVGKIIPVINKRCLVPFIVKCFKEIDTSHKPWFSVLVDRLRGPDLRYPKGPICCETEGHIDLSLVKPKVERRAISHPETLAGVLSEQVYENLKIFAYKHNTQMPFEWEFWESCSDKVPVGKKRHARINEINQWKHGDVVKKQTAIKDSERIEEFAAVLERTLEPQSLSSGDRSVISHNSAEETIDQQDEHELCKSRVENLDPGVLEAGRSEQTTFRREDDKMKNGPDEENLDPRVLRAGDHAVSRRSNRRPRVKGNENKMCT